MSKPQDPAVLNIAFMTSGGLAPCLASSISNLVKEYYFTQNLKFTVRLYKSGYKGILMGESVIVPNSDLPTLVKIFAGMGGSPIGSSRVKLTNVADCVKRGYVQEGEDPLAVAADRLREDGVDVLHTIGGDDTNTQAAQLSFYLKAKNYDLTVIGMPKTVDNDVYPINQTLGAMTAATESAQFFKNVVNESSCSPRMLIIHECMGRHSGYLTAEAAHQYTNFMKDSNTGTLHLPSAGLHSKSYDIHAVWIPEVDIDIKAEGERLRRVMDQNDNVNIFLSEGAGVQDIVNEKIAAGEHIEKDAFGHVRLESVNPGAYFATRLKELVGAEKVLVQKSGYFARSAAAGHFDRALIQKCAAVAVQAAMRGESGVVGEDDDNDKRCGVIAFERIKGGKPFDTTLPWYTELMTKVECHGAM
ncbi:hypothetical protein TrVE_jg9047 [Triparma verrucosa]|uniref:Phosphofructokinase domain-containing protein n=1 Tax=Triparma verrucosa TaxID=1606542 RepID=A0A9W7C0K6_9STRA|nr:hypothetical protein TrVE_jg9047 [Triparma verrucosa]